jgi:hypothetical protein
MFLFQNENVNVKVKDSIVIKGLTFTQKEKCNRVDQIVGLSPIKVFDDASRVSSVVIVGIVPVAAESGVIYLAFESKHVDDVSILD